ncbi:MAG: metal-dependent hydrolase [Acidimicrobiales bacterium]
MSWAAHELESYVIQKHVRVPVAYLGVLAGTLLPDVATKLWVYGFSVGGHHVGAADPARFHRGWPGLGFTHSLTFGLVVAAIVLWRTRNTAWAAGLLIGQWAHALTDINDSVGTMLFFPFSTVHFSTGMWAYAATEGRHGDAAAYYSSLGGAWDVVWLGIALLSWRALSTDYFRTTVAPVDGAWARLQRRLALPDVVVVAAYRAWFLYGACRIAAWTIWAHAVDHSPWDLSWGGPWFVEAAGGVGPSARSLLVATVTGTVGLAAAAMLLWRLCGSAVQPAAATSNTAGR